MSYPWHADFLLAEDAQLPAQRIEPLKGVILKVKHLTWTYTPAAFYKNNRRIAVSQCSLSGTCDEQNYCIFWRDGNAGCLMYVCSSQVYIISIYAFPQIFFSRSHVIACTNSAHGVLHSFPPEQLAIPFPIFKNWYQNGDSWETGNYLCLNF